MSTFYNDLLQTLSEGGFTLQAQRIFKVALVQIITDEELKVLKKFNIVYDIWEDLHSPEKYNYKEAKNEKE